jgi:hypothetical protein
MTSIFKLEGFAMSPSLSRLLEKMTPDEQAEVESFAAFILARRNLQKPQWLNDDISSQELMALVTASGGFDWLRAEEEDMYSIEDGDEVQWPSAS